MTTTPTPRGRPWQRGRPGPQRTDTVVQGRTLLAEIKVYDDVTLLTRRTALGTWRQYPVDPAALTQALAGQPQTSSLLPRNTLGTGRIAGVPFFVVYVPAHRRTLRTAQRDYEIPLPPLVWAGCGSDYRLWAVASADYPTSSALPLMKAPFPNCYADGRICWGDVEARPNAGPGTLGQVLSLFLEGSLFNLHLADGKSVRYRQSIIARWAQLAKRKDQTAGYPLKDLMPAEYQLGWLLAGGPWGGGR